MRTCVRACVHSCVRLCVRACVRVCVTKVAPHPGAWLLEAMSRSLDLARGYTNKYRGSLHRSPDFRTKRALPNSVRVKCVVVFKYVELTCLYSTSSRSQYLYLVFTSSVFGQTHAKIQQIVFDVFHLFKYTQCILTLPNPLLHHLICNITY